jgi:hypothetical protein
MALGNAKLVFAYLHVISTKFMKKSIATRQCMNGLKMSLMNSILFPSWELVKREVKKSTEREQQKQSKATPTPNQTTDRITKQIKLLFTTAFFPGSFAKFV